MGDRANICTGFFGRENHHASQLLKIYMYTHWDGTSLPVTLQDALKRGQSRWDDPQYLNRIIFSEMIQNDVLDDTGYGLSTEIGDNEHEIIYVNHDTQSVLIGDKTWSFDEYIALDMATELTRWW